MKNQPYIDLTFEQRKERYLHSIQDIKRLTFLLVEVKEREREQ
jgi:hypothetical protein